MKLQKVRTSGKTACLTV